MTVGSGGRIGKQGRDIESRGVKRANGGVDGQAEREVTKEMKEVSPVLFIADDVKLGEDFMRS